MHTHANFVQTTKVHEEDPSIVAVTKVMIIYSFSENKTLCPVRLFMEYEKPTHKFYSINNGEEL